MPHIHDAIDFTVSIYIVFDNRVLFIHHKQLDMWLPIGGHIELDEDPEQAAYREIKEESGLVVELYGKRPEVKVIPGQAKLLIAPIYMDIHKISETHRHIGMVYFAKSTTNSVKLAEKEHKAIKWLSKEDLTKYDVLPQVQFYAERALEMHKS